MVNILSWKTYTLPSKGLYGQGFSGLKMITVGHIYSNVTHQVLVSVFVVRCDHWLYQRRTKTTLQVQFDNDGQPSQRILSDSRRDTKLMHSHLIHMSKVHSFLHFFIHSFIPSFLYSFIHSSRMTFINYFYFISYYFAQYI